MTKEETRKKVRQMKFDAEAKEKILLAQISKLAGMIGHKICDIQDNRRGWYDDENPAFNNVPDLLKDYDDDVKKIEQAALIFDSTAFELSNHDLTLENIFDL
jgi:hypothetical protein